MKVCALVAATMAVVALSLPTFAQGRGSVQISNPGSNMGAVSSSVMTFSAYSTGAGNLPRFGGSPGGTLNSSASFNVGRSAGDSSILSPYANSSSSMMPEARAGMKLKGGPQLTVDQSAAPQDIQSVFSKATLATGMDISKVQDILGAAPAQAITSLAPTGTGTYADSMREGERAFRDGNYLVAFDKFRMANDIAGRDPESLLSMAHAKFAGGSYSSSAFYLRQVLRVLPQLLQVNLQPRDFYSDRTSYVRDMERLRNYIAMSPNDADGQLLMAYFAWFDPTMGPKVAQQAIAQGLAKPNLPQATSGLEMFSEAMNTAGRSSPPPSATTRPAYSSELSEQTR